MFHAYRYWHFAIMFLIAHKSANSCVSFAGTIGGHDDDTIKFCQAHGITYEAYSPLGGDDLGGAHRLNTNCGLHVVWRQIDLQTESFTGCVCAQASP